jgi:hypothetical protein
MEMEMTALTAAAATATDIIERKCQSRMMVSFCLRRFIVTGRVRRH